MPWQPKTSRRPPGGDGGDGEDRPASATERRPPPASGPDDPPGARPRRPWPFVAAALAYAALSAVIWWHVLPHPTTVTTCDCGDSALTLWVIKWPAYALSHGLNPFYSDKLLVPVGINMAPNSLGLGVLAAPVTWLWGPVASLNLIDLVSPPCRRWPCTGC